MKIKNKVIKPYYSIYIIAEVASSHNGDVSLALEISEAVKETGADAIKFQVFNSEKLLVPTHHKYQEFKKIEFREKDWYQIITKSISQGLSVIVEIYDEKSFEFVRELEITAYKIPTSDLSNPILLHKIVSTMKPVILSVGAATLKEISASVRRCEEIGNKNIILMHGYQSYPTMVEDTNFRLITHLKKEYNYEVGFADHVDAEKEHAFFFPIMAIGCGASVIEKHITLNRDEKGRDYYSSLNPSEFTRMVAYIRDCEKAYGITEFGCSLAELKYRQLMKKMIVASSDINKGYEIKKDDIMFRRTDEKGLKPEEFQKILGNAARNITKYGVIKESDRIKDN